MNKQLYFAVCHNDLVAVKKILKKNKKYENFFEPITKALGISLDININIIDNRIILKNPLSIACVYGNLDIIKELLCHKNIDPNISFSYISYKLNIKIAKEFIMHPKFKNGNEFFLFCYENGFYALVKMMINIPTINIYIKNKSGCMILEILDYIDTHNINYIEIKRLFKECIIKDIKFLPLLSDIIRHIVINYL